MSSPSLLCTCQATIDTDLSRCLSGVDSFAFDLQNPRPYDAVMPVEKTFKIPKSVSCDDTLLYHAVKDTAAPEVQAERGNDEVANTEPRQSARGVEPQRPAYQLNNRSTTGGSTHNERARQRMERVKMATMKREQARLEEQNRKEVARITRKLAAEQEQRKYSNVSNQILPLSHAKLTRGHDPPAARAAGQPDFSTQFDCHAVPTQDCRLTRYYALPNIRSAHAASRST